MGFEFVTSPRIVFGRGAVKKLPGLCAGYGRHFLIVTGGSSLKRSGVLDALLAGMAAQGIACTVYDGAAGEPTPEMVDAAAALGRSAGADAVLGIGGGSAMDTAKAAAGIATNGGPVVEYLEGVGTGRRMDKRPLPFLAIPTTSGTGAEATKNAVISDPAAGYKMSFRSDWLLARAAIVDPELTVGVPANVTAWSGMDALTQLMEAYISRKSQPITDALALSGIGRVAASLIRAYRDGGDIEAREGMAYGSFLSGVCLANAGLGADHGIAAAYGAVLGISHGLACAVLLPHVMELNMPHMGPKAADLAEALTGRRYDALGDNARSVTDFINGLAEQLSIPPRLGIQGMDEALLERVYGAVSRSSMGGNPVELSRDEVMELIRITV